jgi:hypothetical protein
VKLSERWQTIQFCCLIPLIALAGFHANTSVGILAAGLELAAAVKADVPDTGDYIIGNPGDPVIVVYPTGYAPPYGLIVTPNKSALSDGNAFYINDNSSTGRPPVRFYIKKSASYTSQGIPIDISPPAVTTAAQVGVRVATAISNVGISLHVNASGQDGNVYLSYDYASDPASTGNDVSVAKDVTSPFPGSVDPWTPGGLQNDIQHIQWAVDNVHPGGTVLLKQYGIDATPTPTPFNFGRNGNIVVYKDVTIQGEYTAKEEFSDVGSGGWVLKGTTISGGTQMQIGNTTKAVNFSIKDIIFDGFYAGAIRIKSTYGYNEISGCHFRNYSQAGVFRGNVMGAFPIMADGGLTAQEIDGLTGVLKVMNNFFGQPSYPTDNFNNLMHFSNCNLDLEISENKIEDACWGGFLVFGNKGHSIITRNTINKTKSYSQDGMAIGLGLTTPIMFSRYTYNGGAEITDNKITIGSPNSTGIVIADYPASQSLVPVPGDISYVISGNTIIMNNSLRYALGCIGACSNSTWSNNTVQGSASCGIYLSKLLPPFAPPFVLPFDKDAYVSTNSFVNIDMRGFIVLNNYVSCDAYAISNTGTNIGVPAGACSNYIQDVGTNNTFNQLPHISPIADRVAYVGMPFVHQVFATDEALDVLTYALDGAPQWLSINPTSGYISGTPSALGTHIIGAMVSDNKCGVSSDSFAVDVRCPPVTALSTANVWLGLKNSDDVGTKFDLLAEVMVNGTLIGSGQIDGVPGGSSGFNNAVKKTINLSLLSMAGVCSGDTLSIKLSARIAASSGHRSGTARLWFNDGSANSQFGASVQDLAKSYFLLSAFKLGTSAGTGPKASVDVFVDRTKNGNRFEPFGTWSIVF